MTVTRTRRIIDSAGADAVVRAAEAYARERSYRVVVAVVDPAGELVRLGRTEGAQAASARVAVDKARTAAIFVRPSRELEEQVSSGRLGALALHGAAALTGGIPLVVGGAVVGAVGVSGETPDEDEAVAAHAAAVDLTTADAAILTQAGARIAAEAAGAAATARGVAPVVAAVDADGALLYLWRPDAAQVASVGVATDKARTAAIYRRPSKDFEDQATGGRPSALHLARSVPLQGGIPIVVDGQVAGAVGVSGASSADEDQELAVLGAEAAQAAAAATSNGAHVFPREAVDAKFDEGGLLLETGGYKIDAGRRERPGPPELHEREVDVMRVVQGSATVVTGGTIAGDVIDGGTPHSLGEGDVIAIPQGVPHQFTEVSDPFLYFVVKVAA
ncbi:MAG TPA: heme-binding protein [Solirubrobacteraceae bacterium]|nr:heme-binding protein [Solirubrobacteraceae bacterium]